MAKVSQKQISPGQVYQHRKNQTKFVQVLRDHGSEWWIADIDTAVETAISGKTLLRDYKLNGQEMHPGGFKPERSAHLQAARDEQAKPSPQIAAGQHFHLRDDLTDTIMVIGPGNRPGMWTCKETSEGADDHKFQMSEQILAADYVLIVDPPAPKPVEAKLEPAPAKKADGSNGNGEHHISKEELHTLEFTIALHAITTDRVDRLNVEKSKLVCPCGDSNEAKDLSFPEYLKSVARFYLRHERCFATNVLPGLHEDRIDPKQVPS